MGVKYYQIREFETAHPESHDGIVTESELWHRLLAVRSRGIMDRQCLDILLRGEKEHADTKAES